jgi:hypothetical protein
LDSILHFLKNCNMFRFLSTSLPLAMPAVLVLEYLLGTGAEKYTSLHSFGNNSTIALATCDNMSFVRRTLVEKNNHCNTPTVYHLRNYKY